MIHHFSMSARQPLHVATVLAEILNGQVMPFPPNPNSYVAVSGDDYGTMIEVYPDGSEILPGRSTEEQALFEQRQATQTYNPFHVAISVSASLEDIQAIGDREGWRVLHCSRDGLFDVIEFWVENRLMLELLTPDMATTYQAAMAPEKLAEFMNQLSMTPAHA